MLDFLIGSLTTGLKLIGLMTPVVLLVMWGEWRDCRSLVLPKKLREKENNSSKSRPARPTRPASTPPTGGSGVSARNQPHVFTNDSSNWVSSPEYIADRLGNVPIFIYIFHVASK